MFLSYTGYMKNRISFHIAITAFVLLAAILFFGMSTTDIVVQDFLFNQESKTWLLDAHAQPYHLIFYVGIKRVLVALGIGFVALLFFARKKGVLLFYQKGMQVVILSAIFVPASVGILKRLTNMPCPKNEIRYGGVYPQTAVWERYPPTVKKLGGVRGWPAGHASAGFALLSLFFLFKTARNRYIALGSALCIGWVMGAYKMLIGDHFLALRET